MSEAERIRAEYIRRAADPSAERYDPASPAQLFIRQPIERALVEALREAGALPLEGKRVLDVGCGSGQWLRDLETYGAERRLLAGVELVPDRVRAAREHLAGADIREGDATALPLEDGAFDLVTQSMMITSIIDDEVRRRAASEMARVLAPGGVIVWYDFFVSNPRNPAVRGVPKREVEALFPGFELRWRRVTLAPPLIRLLAPRLRPLALALQSLRLLNTHAMATLRRTWSPRQ